MFNKPNTNHLIQVLGFALLAFTFFVFFAEEIFYFINTVSLRGYSMIEAVNIYNGKFEILNQAFIETSHHKNTSLIYWVYVMINTIFGFNALYISYFILLLEFCIIAFSVWYFLNSLELDHPFIKSILYCSLVLYTDIEQYNWASFGQIFNGEWYNIPNSLFLIVLSKLLKKEISHVNYLLLVIFLIHPSKGASLIVVTIPVVLYLIAKNRNLLNSSIKSIIICSLTSIIYIFIILNGEEKVLMDPKLWYLIQDSHNYHILKGSIDREFIVRKLMPIFLLTISICLNLKNTNIYPVIINMFIVSLIGKLIDLFSQNPFLLTLILHRITENIILISLLLIFTLNKKSYFSKIFEFVGFYCLLFDPLFINKYTVVIALIFITLIFINKENSIFLSILTLLIILYSNKLFPVEGNYVYEDSGVFTRGRLLIIMCVGLLLIAKSNKINFEKTSIIIFLLVVLNFSYNTYFVEYINENEKISFTPKINGYYQAQVWANENTSPDSIFMPDPLIPYAWRDFSNRNSFGTPREFLTSWVYTRDNKIFTESVSRASVFIDDPIKKMIDFEYDNFTQLISEAYYKGELSIFNKLCNEYGVDYYLWDKNTKAPGSLTIVFESNSHFILKLQDNC